MLLGIVLTWSYCFAKTSSEKVGIEPTELPDLATTQTRTDTDLNTDMRTISSFRADTTTITEIDSEALKIEKLTGLCQFSEDSSSRRA